MQSNWNQALFLMGGLAAGAGLMYMLDPERGHTRRALLRDKAGSMVLHTSTDVGKQARNVRNHAKGLAHEVTSRLHHNTVADIDLENKIRAEVANVIPHPEMIHVRVQHGRVTLSGPVLADNVKKLVEQCAMIPGVMGVENRMAVYQSQDQMPLHAGQATA